MLNNEHSIPMKGIHLEREAVLNIEWVELTRSEFYHFYTIRSWRFFYYDMWYGPSGERACLSSSAEKFICFMILIGAKEVKYMLICGKSRGNLGRDTMHFLCSLSFVWTVGSCLLEIFAQFISFQGRDISNFCASLEDYVNNYCMSNSP